MLGDLCYFSFVNNLRNYIECWMSKSNYLLMYWQSTFPLQKRLGPQPCPKSNPYAINGGDTCCLYYRQRYDAGSCPGNNMTSIDDPVECCVGGHIPCPNTNGGCKNHPLAHGKIIWMNLFVHLKKSWLTSFSEYCPAFPKFRRVESDIGYFLDVSTDGLMTAPDATEHCRTAFSTPSYLPKIDTPKSMAELLTSIQFFTGKKDFCTSQICVFTKID